TFVRLMALPNLAAMAANVLVFFLIFRHQIPVRFKLPEASGVRGALPKNATQLTIAAIGLGLVNVTLVVFGALGWPLYLPALIGAIGLLAVSHVRHDVEIERVAAGVVWSLPLFVIGLYTV